MRDTLNEKERQQNREMDVESLAKYVFRHLKENLNPEPSHRDFFFPVVRLRHILFPDGALNKFCPDHAKLLEAITLLERRGLVVRESSYPVDFFIPEEKVVVYFTTIGMKTNIEDETLLLVDKPEEIVDVLEQKVGTLDDVVRQYYIESLRAFQEELYISSVICLGAASERAIHWLAESIEPYSEKYRGKIETKRRGNISDLTEYLSHSVIPNIFGDDEEFAGELKELLDLLGNLYRENRNKAGHPKVVYKSWLEEGQGTLLLYFRRYITTICEAIKRLKNNGNV